MIGHRCKCSDVFSRVVLISREAYFLPLWQQMVSRLLIINIVVLRFLKLKINSGNYSGGATPLPIPNREVKPTSADGTALETGWERRSLPDLNIEASVVLIEAFLLKQARKFC